MIDKFTEGLPLQEVKISFILKNINILIFLQMIKIVLTARVDILHVIQKTTEIYVKIIAWLAATQIGKMYLAKEYFIWQCTS